MLGIKLTGRESICLVCVSPGFDLTRWVVVAHIFDPSTKEAEMGISLNLRPTWSTNEFQDYRLLLYSQGYTENPCLEKAEQTKMKRVAFLSSP